MLHCDEDNKIKEVFKVQCGLDCVTRDHCAIHSLAAPKFGSSHSWTNNNPSAYLWDFGMWNACHESREIIKKHYKTEYWTTKLSQNDLKTPPNWDFCKDVDVCIPFISPRSDGYWSFSIHPNRDLVCLQPLNVEHSFDKFYGCLTEFCMVGWDTSLRGFTNLAFEYDSSWYDGLEKMHDPSDLFEEMSPRGLFIRALVSLDDKDCYAPEMLWLIDYSLKRDKDKGDEAASKKGKVFNAIYRKFVQVDSDSRNYSDTRSRSALQFVSELGFMFDDRPKYCCLYKSRMYDSDRSDAGGYNIDRDVRVLACEENT